ncbi:MAG: dTMP kinase [Halioglobus sp.]|nr:dTMP kinase [Halioglobus sp.]|tara:strand:- start:501 stop:1157 length:657 start_codon:yes stop_codon:yes gene_type:complete
MAARGLFITVEGIEGVGKSSNLAFLAAQLREYGVDVMVTREPGGTPLGEDIRALLLSLREQPVSPMSELLLIFAARAQHLCDVIEPHLAAGRWVLCDRFTDATYAYQGGGRGIDAAAIAELETLVQGELRPDYTLLLDVDVATGLERARGRGELDRIEREAVEFFEQVRARYLALAQASSGRFRVVDARQPLDAVQRELAQLGRELLTCWGVRHPEAG